MIGKMYYLRQLEASLEELERAYIHINMNLYKDKQTNEIDVKKYIERHCSVIVSHDRKRIQWYILDEFAIDVSHSNMDKLRELFDHMKKELLPYPPLVQEDLIKNTALGYIQNIGLT